MASFKRVTDKLLLKPGLLQFNSAGCITFLGSCPKIKGLEHSLSRPAAACLVASSNSPKLKAAFVARK